jgi:hypothetical protein
MRTSLALVALVLVACAGRQATPAPAAIKAAPRYVDVTLIDTTIGPTKADGAPWDGFARPPVEGVGQLAELLTGAASYATVAGMLAGPVFNGIVPPEPFGQAWLACESPSLADIRELKSQQDTFTPTWRGEPTWQHVLLSPRVRIHVSLMDEDLSDHDPIGTFELNERDIESALAAGHIVQIKVADQTHNQVLFAGLSARETAKPRQL